MKRKIIDLLKWKIAVGRENQNFLGAKWITPFLGRVSERSKRKWALRILNLSPHYFFDSENPEFAQMKLDEYLETSFRIISDSRRRIYDEVFKDRLSSHETVLEYGCGPGFLAFAASPFVKKIYACDISPGALACAKIVNCAENIDFLLVDDKGLGQIPDGSLDAIFSFAVIQHLSDAVFEIVLENCRKKLRKGGRIVLHIQLPDNVWKTEDEWRNDSSLHGKMRYKHGLYCFGRTVEHHEKLIKTYGFSEIAFDAVTGIADENDDELLSQRVVTAYKK